MLHPTSLILLPFVVLVSSVLNLSGASWERGLHMIETAEAIIKLQKEYDYLKNSFNDYIIILEANNNLIHAMEAYRNAYALTKGTDCAGEEPQNENADVDEIKNFVKQCLKSLNFDERNKLFNKILIMKDKVIEIDSDAHAKYNSNRSSWDKVRKKAIKQLNGVLTPNLDAELQSDVSAVLELLTISLDECFKSEIAERLKNLVRDTKTMNTCLDLKS